MTAESKRILPSWAPRLSQGQIRRLYQTDALGIYDEDLINDVGYGLLARCQSVANAADALGGKARCPSCSAVVTHDGDKGALLRCGCGWTLTWGEYLKAIQHDQLGGAEPVLEQFRAFLGAFPAARAPKAKMILIDSLLHGFHQCHKTNRPTRPVAVNLIEGRLSAVVAFLDDLSRGNGSTPGVTTNYTRWNEGIQENRDWYASRRDGPAARTGGGDE